MTQRAVDDESWAVFCGNKANAIRGIFFFMLELDNQQNELKSAQLFGFGDSSIRDYMCAHLEITSTQTVTFLLISPDYVLYTPSAVTLAEGSSVSVQ